MDSIQIKDIKRGDIYWECEGGQDAAFLALYDARKVSRNPDRHWTQGYEVESLDLATGKPQRHYEALECAGYGIHLYRGPQYTRPDWSVLLRSLAGIAITLVDGSRVEAADRAARATQAAAEATQAQIAAEEAQALLGQEVAQLRARLSRVEAAVARPGTGIEVQRRVEAALRDEKGEV